jgi:hypothetical protein
MEILERIDCISEEILERIDCISEIDDNDKDKLKELWLTEVSNAVEKAHQLCEYNLAFLRNLPQKEPYVGYNASNTNNDNKTKNRFSYNSNNTHRQQRNFR